jgi:hypothetical protein
MRGEQLFDKWASGGRSNGPGYPNHDPRPDCAANAALSFLLRNAVNSILRCLNRNRLTRTGPRVISLCPADLQRRTADATRTNLPCEQALGKMHVGGVRRALTAGPPFFHPHPARARFGSADRQGTGIVSEPSRGNCDLGFRAAGGRVSRESDPSPRAGT